MNFKRITALVLSAVMLMGTECMAAEGIGVYEETAAEDCYMQPLDEAVLYDNEYIYTVGQSVARNQLELVNKFRTEGNPWYWDEKDETKIQCDGLAELVYDYDLEKIAIQRAAEIVRKFSHTRPMGENRASILGEYGYASICSGENIAFGFNTFEDAFNAFLEEDAKYEDQGHRRNMLGDGYNRIGIGHIIYNNTHYWVQEFAGSENVSEPTEPIDGEMTFVIKETTKAAPPVKIGETEDAVVVAAKSESVQTEDGRKYTVEYASVCEYTGKKVKAPVQLKSDDGNVLEFGKDYKVSYKNNKLANMNYVGGKFVSNGAKRPEIIIKFIKKYKKSKMAHVNFDIQPVDIAKAVVTPKASTVAAKNDKKVKFFKNAVYTAPKAVKGVKVSSKDIEALYMVNKATKQKYTVNDSVGAPAGVYTLMVTGKGNFYGTNETVTFTLERN